MASDWQQVKQIAMDALDVSGASRAALLDDRCGADAALRRDVESLLSAGGLPGPFLDLDHAPDRLGPYRVGREIGRGGMGAVYAAERDDGQFEQRVAIKVIKRGMDSAAVIQRFFAERQILARLTHPGITRLLDGGMTSDGRPYVVMELVEGEPIGEYCGRRALSIDDRLKLLIAVCDAVEYAHQSLVLHRDIKAGNILVDANGVPKLLDFGIAKLIESGDDAQQTAIESRAWTPSAASPEQTRGEVLTTASDVYSLGVLAYELLTGKPPYDVRDASPDRAARIISETTPQPPSAAADGADGKTLRGELDQVVLKALEKAPGDRYPRAADFAEDLRRFRLGLPVAARRRGSADRIRKFVARHARSLAIAAVVAVAIGVLAGRAIAEGRLADRRFRDLRQLANTFVFEFYDAIAPLPGATPARELVITRGLQYLDGLERDAGGDLDLKRELAQAYERIGVAQGSFHESNLGKTSDARANLQKSLALFEEIAKRRPRDANARIDLAEVLLRLSAITVFQKSNGESLAFNTRAVDLLEQTSPLDARGEFTLAMGYFGLAEVAANTGRLSDALQARNRSIAILRDATAKNPEDWQSWRYLAQSYKRLVSLYFSKMKDPAKAGAALDLAIAIDERLAAHDPKSAVSALDLATDQAFLASIKQRTGDAVAAVALMRQSIDARRALLEADPRNFRIRSLLAEDAGKLGAWLRGMDRLAESRDAIREGLDLAAALNPDNPDTAPIVSALRAEEAATATRLARPR